MDTTHEELQEVRRQLAYWRTRLGRFDTTIESEHYNHDLILGIINRLRRWEGILDYQRRKARKSGATAAASHNPP